MYPLILTWVLDGGETSASRSGLFAPSDNLLVPLG